MIGIFMKCFFGSLFCYGSAVGRLKRRLGKWAGLVWGLGQLTFMPTFISEPSAQNSEKSLQMFIKSIYYVEYFMGKRYHTNTKK